RPMHPDWARRIRDDCVHAEVPFFFKQFGEWAPLNTAAGDDPDPKGRSVMALPDGRVTDAGWNGGAGPHLTGAQPLWRTGKHRAGDMLDGQQWHQFPQKEAITA